MRRSQLYLITLFMIFLSIIGFTTFIDRTYKEMEDYNKFISNVFIIYRMQNFYNIVKPLLRINKHKLVPIVVYYNCSNYNISIPNYLHKNATILSLDYKVLPTSSDLKNINWTINSQEVYDSLHNICIFRGYIVDTKLDNSSVILGYTPISVIIENISASVLDLSFINTLDPTVQIKFYPNKIVYKAQDVSGELS